MANVRVSNGSRLGRPDKIVVDPELVQAAMESIQTGKAMEASFDSEKEARANASRLRTHLNNEGHGLRAKVEQDGDEWVLEFKATAEKRDVSKLDERE